MNELNSSLKQIEKLIHRTYFLYKNTSNVVVQAECEDKLLRLFRFINVIETHSSQIIKITGRFLKNKTELRRGVLTSGKTNLHEDEGRSNSLMEQVAN